jgi:hypothetical protein
MTKTDDKSHIRSAAADDADLRKACLVGTEAYRLALIAAGYMLAVRRAA